ncbi:MAG: B12-binding domain-containing radical SAM protein [Verrucomicrobia bacterium]|nr:B12-binding domain-containing radical SAM protein [Verrucomicrobiota bacterium]MBU1733617.1 B12-binding domain-containing radical SAM protein [Verrucomicrobiota bacterium]MBU1856791.1 B12-binding domain-containing radical SAM protein [Verrucomicrobiota bacterium]
MKYKHALALYPGFKGSTATMGIFPPTGLEYIAANITDLVDKVTLLDLRYEQEYQDVEILSGFIKKEIDLLCISIVWNSGFADICDFISKLPDEVTTVVGGNKATAEVEHLFDKCPNIDIVVRGEGEETIRDIINGVPLKDILGLSYRENEALIHNKARPSPDICRVAFPDRSLRRHNYYGILNGVRLTNLTFDTVLASRGCPYNCKFCTFNLNPLGQKRTYAERPIESVMEEIKCIAADLIMFSDDNFFTNPERSKMLCDLIIVSGIKKTFIVQTRIEIARDEELLQKAEKAGFKILLVGIESPHDRILKQFNKGFTQQQVREAFKILNKHNFFIHGYFIYGNIGETEEEMVYIAQFAKELKLDAISFQKLRVEKFSPLKEVIENTPGYHYTATHGSVYSDRYSIKDLKRIRSRIKFKFYTLGQIVKIIQKVRKIQLLTKSELMYIFMGLPKILFNVLKKGIKKKA